MITYCWALDYYMVDLPSKRFYAFWEEKQAVRALKKYLKSITK